MYRRCLCELASKLVALLLGQSAFRPPCPHTTTSICIYVYMYVYMYVHTLTLLRSHNQQIRHTHTHTHERTHAHTHTHTHTNTHKHTHAPHTHTKSRTLPSQRCESRPLPPAERAHPPPVKHDRAPSHQPPTTASECSSRTPVAGSTSSSSCRASSRASSRRMADPPLSPPAEGANCCTLVAHQSSCRYKGTRGASVPI